MSRPRAGVLAVVAVIAAVGCEEASGPASEANAWMKKACACSDEACATALGAEATALAERVAPALKTDEQRLEYGKAIATGQGCLKRLRGE